MQAVAAGVAVLTHGCVAPNLCRRAPIVCPSPPTRCTSAGCRWSAYRWHGTCGRTWKTSWMCTWSKCTRPRPKLTAVVVRSVPCAACGHPHGCLTPRLCLCLCLCLCLRLCLHLYHCCAGRSCRRSPGRTYRGTTGRSTPAGRRGRTPSCCRAPAQSGTSLSPYPHPHTHHTMDACPP